ncbi:hypothetical protein K466DRAFT_570164 [Polyporus arcularius HHB13444]|uniref:Uncharacterized protein n=1 Tax=Polyporus arcularius HHB13444 TaxID=1314778 RepID=A0A5C3NSL7_9APHY|nr:hypothetical protein K466DRAFT_570164 [Polyporus arcularius HHB13444]
MAGCAARVEKAFQELGILTEAIKQEALDFVSTGRDFTTERDHSLRETFSEMTESNNAAEHKMKQLGQKQGQQLEARPTARGSCPAWVFVKRAPHQEQAAARRRDQVRQCCEELDQRRDVWSPGRCLDVNRKLQSGVTKNDSKFKHDPHPSVRPGTSIEESTY